MSQSRQVPALVVSPSRHSSAHASGEHAPAKQPTAHVSSRHVPPSQYERTLYWLQNDSVIAHTPLGAPPLGLVPLLPALPPLVDPPVLVAPPVPFFVGASGGDSLPQPHVRRAIRKSFGIDTAALQADSVPAGRHRSLDGIFAPATR